MSKELSYKCDICLSVNHVSRFHCQHCGTIPERYSVLKTPARFMSDDLGIPKLIPVCVARGADRVENHHTSRSYLRTVPMDYYAEV